MKPILLVSVLYLPSSQTQFVEPQQENSSQRFRWRGSFPKPSFPLFDGEHAFRFLGGDEFRAEIMYDYEGPFLGALAFVMKTNLLDRLECEI